MLFILRQFFEEINESSKFLFLALATVFLALFFVVLVDIQTFEIILNRGIGFNLDRDRGYFLLPPDIGGGSTGRMLLLTLLVISPIILISILLTFFSRGAITFQNSLKITGFGTISFILQSLLSLIAVLLETPIIFKLGIFFMVLSLSGIISYGYVVITKRSFIDTFIIVNSTLFVAFIIELLMLSVVAFILFFPRH